MLHLVGSYRNMRSTSQSIYEDNRGTNLESRTDGQEYLQPVVPDRRTALASASDSPLSPGKMLSERHVACSDAD